MSEYALTSANADPSVLPGTDFRPEKISGGLKLIINGHDRSGKDTVAAALARKLDLRLYPASEHYAYNIIMKLFPGRYANVQECMADRFNHRPAWNKLIAGAFQMDPNIQYDILRYGDIFCGVRKLEELRALSKKFRTVTMWLSRSGTTLSDEWDYSGTMGDLCASDREDLQYASHDVDYYMPSVKDTSDKIMDVVVKDLADTLVDVYGFKYRSI